MSTFVTHALRVRARIAYALILALAAPAHAVEPPAPSAEATRVAPSQVASAPAVLPGPLAALVAEALANNPEVRAALREREAAGLRVAPAGALEDPMLEAGLINVPTRTLNLSREDMTMKMLGISQRLPYPGKRALRRELAEMDAQSVARAWHETANRVARETRVAYYEIALVTESARLVERNRDLLAQLLKVVEGRYTVGQGSQVDVLRAQTQLSRMSEELIRLARERPMAEAELNRALGRPASAAAPLPQPLGLQETPLAFDRLYEQALASRPQLAALRNLVARNERAIELATRDRLPDFDLRLSYGQRENMPDGTRRTDMITFVVAMNLPVRRQTRINPRIAEAQVMHEQALALYDAQRNETAMKLRQQIAVAEQSARAAQLYRTEILPQSRLTMEAALAAYQVNRLEFAPLLDNQMAIYSFELARIAAVASYNKALAEIDLLTGRELPGTPRLTEERKAQ